MNGKLKICTTSFIYSVEQLLFISAMDQWIDRMTNKYPWFNSVLPVLTFLWVWTLTIAFFAKGIDIEPSNVSIIKIVYVTFALICTVLFQVSF